jgi:hypothetical protein
MLRSRRLPLHSPDKVEIGEDERLFRLEAAGDNILCVLEREGVALLELERRLEEEFLVVCEISTESESAGHDKARRPALDGLPRRACMWSRRRRLTGKLDHQRAVEHVLEPLGKDEGDHVTEMHRVGRRAATGVEVERLLLLVAVQNQVEFAVSKHTWSISVCRTMRHTASARNGGRSSPMREEGFPSEQQMRLATGQALKALEQLVVDALGAKLVDEVVVVDSHLHDIAMEGRRDH